MAMSKQTSWCDLVLEGGGVKGLGLVGAVTALDRSGFQFRRIAGTSAGAIVGSLVAAGMSAPMLLSTMQSVDYAKFRDPTLLSRFGVPGIVLSVLLTKGAYKGSFFHHWLKQQLEALGVITFRDLKITEEWAKALPPEQRYKLVVVVSDITHGRMVRLPWDYKKYGLNPDEQLVADAVRSSMSIPFFYQPAHIQRALAVDGGLLSNYPIELFDSITDWPTLGVKLSARRPLNQTLNPVHNIIDYGKAILATATNGHDQIFIDDVCTQKRTIFVDATGISATDFDLTSSQQSSLFQSGQDAAAKFLQTWDYTAYKKECPAKINQP